MNRTSDDMDLAASDEEMARLLASMPLRTPSDRLHARVLRECRRGSAARLGFRMLGVAASIGIVVGSIALLMHDHPGAPSQRRTIGLIAPATTVAATVTSTVPATAASVKPVRIIRTLSDITDDGVVATVGGEPFRRLRRRTVQQVVLIDPKRGTQVTYRQPHEQIVLVRVKSF